MAKTKKEQLLDFVTENFEENPGESFSEMTRVELQALADTVEDPPEDSIPQEELFDSTVNLDLR